MVHIESLFRCTFHHFPGFRIIIKIFIAQKIALGLGIGEDIFIVILSQYKIYNVCHICKQMLTVASAFDTS